MKCMSPPKLDESLASTRVPSFTHLNIDVASRGTENHLLFAMVPDKVHLKAILHYVTFVVAFKPPER